MSVCVLNNHVCATTKIYLQGASSAGGMEVTRASVSELLRAWTILMTLPFIARVGPIDLEPVVCYILVAVFCFWLVSAAAPQGGATPWRRCLMLLCAVLTVAYATRLVAGFLSIADTCLFAAPQVACLAFVTDEQGRTRSALQPEECGGDDACALPDLRGSDF